MGDITYPIVPQTLPSGFCGTTWQDILNQFASNLFVTIPGQNNQLVVSATKPSDTGVAWLQLDSLGRPTLIYFFGQGAWLSKHPDFPGKTIWWFDVLPDFTNFDGGDANAVSAISGPMWRLAQRPDGTVIAAQFPIAQGTLPSGKILNVGDVGGEEKHSLTVEELAPHTHSKQLYLFDYPRGSGPHDDPTVWEIADPDPAELAAQTPAAFVTDSTGGLGSPPVVQPHNTMGPYVTGYLLQRSSRLYYRVD